VFFPRGILRLDAARAIGTKGRDAIGHSNLMAVRNVDIFKNWI